MSLAALSPAAQRPLALQQCRSQRAAACGAAARGGSWRQGPPPARTSRRRRGARAAVCQAMPDPSRSSLFRSEIVQKDVDELFREFSSLSAMIGRFADFDTAGKKLYLERMEEMIEKLDVFIARVKLADDAWGNELLRSLNVQMLNASTNRQNMVDSWRQEAEEMRRVIAREEATADPVELELIKTAWKQRFNPGTSFDMQKAMSDPLISSGFADPLAIKAVSEVVDDPRKLEDYRDRPGLYALLKFMLENGGRP